MAEQVSIARLGAKADGFADTPSGPVYVPKVLPGEAVTIEREGSRGHLVAVDRASPDREAPFCPYFERCGGCATQHMRPGFYQEWKRDIVVAALQQARLTCEVAPLIDAHGEGRRRLTLHARYPDRNPRVGYMAARSHQLVEVEFCPIAAPALLRQGPAVARAVAQHLVAGRKPLDVQVTATETGLDVDVRGYGAARDQDRLQLVQAAADLDLARLSLHGDTLVERRPPTITMGRATVVLPPGSFLQATKLGEDVLGGLVVDACRGAKRIGDLFSGSGPFALRLAEAAEVHAVENDRGAVAALDRAARGTPGLRRVTTEVRDLFRRPLLPPELDRFAAVVLDPPRAGAEAQVKQIAASKVPLVISVSCDPGTFARDAAILIEAGFHLDRVVPVDQFKHSPHVEIVGILRRGATKARR